MPQGQVQQSAPAATTKRPCLLLHRNFFLKAIVTIISFYKPLTTWEGLK